MFFWKTFFLKIFLLVFLSFWKDLCRDFLVVSKFLLEVPKFKEDVLIYLITIMKVRDLILTLLQVTTMLAT